MPIIGTGIFGFGAMLTLYVLLFIRGCQRYPPTFSLPIQLYLVDTFTYSASALSASAVRPSSPQPLYIQSRQQLNCDPFFFWQVTRSMLAFALPLAGAQMFDALGLGMGNTLLAVLAIVMGVPFPIWIWFYGERLRARSSLTTK